jgi:hypothetical protein
MPLKDDLKKLNITTQLPTSTSAAGSHWLKTEPTVRMMSEPGHHNFFKRGIVSLLQPKLKRPTGKFIFFANERLWGVL